MHQCLFTATFSTVFTFPTRLEQVTQYAAGGLAAERGGTGVQKQQHAGTHDDACDYDCLCHTQTR